MPDAKSSVPGDTAFLGHPRGLLTLFFTGSPVVDFSTAKTTDTDSFAAFFRGMLQGGVYLPPSQFESWFVSTAHGDEEIRATLDCAARALQEIGKGPRTAT